MASRPALGARNCAPVLDNEAMERIRRLIEQGMTRKDVAYRLGRSYTQVSKAIAEMGGVGEIRRQAAKRASERAAERDRWLSGIRGRD